MSIPTINFRMVEMNFGSGDTNFNLTKGKVRPYYTKEIAFSKIKVRVSTTKVHLHHPKVDSGDGHQIDLRYQRKSVIFLSNKGN